MTCQATNWCTQMSNIPKHTQQLQYKFSYLWPLVWQNGSRLKKDCKKFNFSCSLCCLWLVLYSLPTYLPIFRGALKHVFLYTVTWRNFQYSSFFSERITSHWYIRSFYHHMALLFSWLFPTDCYCTLWQQSHNPDLRKLTKNLESSMLRRKLKPTENRMGILSLIC